MRAGGELISESHGRAWASGVPLVGVIGNDEHQRTLGSLDGVPFMVVQETISRDQAKPVFADPEGAREAIRAFAEEAMRNIKDAPVPTPPRHFLFEASMPHAIVDAEAMKAEGWRQRSATEYEIELATWDEARRPLATAMSATAVPYRQFFPNGELRSREVFDGWDSATLADAEAAFGDWTHELQAEWIAA